MKAITYYKYGAPEVVKLEDVQQPAPRDNEVLIKVHATTVNRTDCGFRSADYFVTRFFSGLFKPKNPILGTEFAGEIAEFGKNVSTWKIGDRVFGYTDLKMAAHAEFLVMPENGYFATMPANLSYQEAAPICEGAHYALCDIRAAKIKAGQNVLVNGATGAIGSSAVQLLKHFGAKVTAVCDTKNMDLVRSLGADRVIDYTKEDFTKINETFDVVYDAVGKSSFGKCKPLLSKKGIYKSTELGKNSENIFLALITPFLGGKKVLFPIPAITREDVLLLRDLIEKGAYKPVIDRQYKLEEIVEAYRFVETGQKVGNVVLNVT